MAPLVELALRRPKAILVAAGLSVLLALLVASRLELRTSLGELLPEDRPSVKVAAAVAERLPTTSTLAVVVEGGQPGILARYAESAASRLVALEGASELVGRVETGRGEDTAFFERHALLYADRAELERIAAAIEERYAFEVHREAGMLLDEDREPWSAILEASHEQPTGGRYVDEGRGAAVILVRTPVSPGDLDRTEMLVATVEGALPPPPPGITVTLGGNLLTAAETYRQVKDDLAGVGAMGVALVLGVVFVFFRKFRPVLALALAVGVGTSWTFAFAELAVGHLNTATGFLFGIVVGNGINFSIILMSRYLELRREREVAASLFAAVEQSWRATLIAAGAAAAAYGSLAITEFRGFRHFGLIGGAGMLLCWVATFAVVPPLLVLFERVGPLSGAEPRGALVFALTWPSRREPRLVLAIAALVVGAAGAAAVGYLRDPMEYDLRRIDNQPELAVSGARRVAPLLDAIVGRDGQDGVAIAVDDVSQVAPLVAALEKRRDDAPEAPFGRVVTAFDLLPREQPDKLAIVESLRDLRRRARARGLVPPEEDARLARLLDVKPVTLADLPEPLVRPFTERDGTRGRLVYIVPADGKSVWDGRYLVTWAASFRETVLPDGTIIEGSGRSVIFADMLEAIADEAPRATLCSFLLTLAWVVIAFRGRRAAFVVIAAVASGLVVTVGALSLLGSEISASGVTVAPLRLSFLSFVALPLTIGIGADYAVNLVRGLEDGTPLGALGGAVLVCSLTTTLGYGALTQSVNGAIRSFGLAAAAGEIACLAVALIGIVAWHHAGRRRP